MSCNQQQWALNLWAQSLMIIIYVSIKVAFSLMCVLAIERMCTRFYAIEHIHTLVRMLLNIFFFVTVMSSFDYYCLKVY